VVLDDVQIVYVCSVMRAVLKNTIVISCSRSTVGRNVILVLLSLYWLSWLLVVQAFHRIESHLSL